MLLNHKREPVWNHSEGESLCPDCGSPLLARKGEIKVWHWAHPPGRSNTSRCEWAETDWHLTWKRAAQQDGWEVEHPIAIDGKRYRLDAFDARSNLIREFVHSLSPSYVAKHRALSAEYGRRRVTWIFDGHVFVSLRRKAVRNGGIKRLLKPTAKALHDEIGGLVHIQSGPLAGVWRHWKHDVWYRHPNSAGLLAIYASGKQQAVAA